MPLEVVGAGFGRTGTLSMKAALERLGFGPCYHMSEVFAHPQHAEDWLAASEGKPVNWEKLLSGYRATVDWPACAFYRPLAERYPRAKVILTVRDMQKWFESCSATIFAAMTMDDAQLPPPMLGPVRMARKIVVQDAFGGSLTDAARCIALHRAHIEEVKRTIAPDRLLVFDVAEGWGPLCRFLGVSVPSEPFPRVNTREEFIERIRARGRS